MNSPITCFTALIDIAEDEQCEELEDYLRGKGAEVTSSSDTELLQRLQHIIEKCDVVFQQKDLPAQEVEGFFYSIVSLFHIISPGETRGVVDSLATKIVSSGSKENAALRLKLLGLLFCHFPAKDILRYTVLLHRVRMAGQSGLATTLAVDVDKVRQWVELWQLDTPQTRELWRLLWEAHKDLPNKTLSSSILIELLRTYSEADAKDATQLAEKLIALVISDPKQFVFDNLLQLAPIAALEGQRSLQLLRIFVFEKLSSYKSFYEANAEYLQGFGLDHDFCITKMRQLTLTSLAVEAESGEVPFSTLLAQLDMPQEELELFLIDAIRLKLIEARINQLNQKLIVMSSLHRTFESAQWQQLYNRLSSWQQSIQSIKSSLKSVKT